MTDKYDQTAEGDRYRVQSDALAGWFIGPRAENHQLFNELMDQTIKQHQQNRRKYWPTDPEYITKAQKMTPAYKAERKQLKNKLKELNDDLEQSTPVFSPRFQGHMNWDISMPAVLGYISGMVWNPNNVDVTASPITTPYEIIAAEQICDMIGFDRTKTIDPWGHITCGGSIANIEAMWASRNMKFYPLSLQDAVMAEGELSGAKTYMVNVFKPGSGFTNVELQHCTVWQLLNVDVDDACNMSADIAKAAKVTMDKLSELVHPYAYTSIGIYNFLTKHNIKSPRVFVPATCHYSWPKAATVLGLGEDNLIHIKVDKMARQEMGDLRQQLEYCVTNSIPVISVTAVMGSTEESAFDPLTEMLTMRDELKKKGLNYAILADAAWGAYMRTMMIDPDHPEEVQKAERRKGKKGREQKERSKSSLISNYVPITPLSQHAQDNLNALRHADTVTSDPHKTGYVPYPAGGLSYRNGTMKDFVLLAAPEVFHSEDDLSVGVNGLEGSKPGAAGAGVLLSHRVIGMDKYGYGRILGQCVYGSKLYYCLWLNLSKPTDPFIIKPYLPCSEKDKLLAKELIIGKTNLEIVETPGAMSLLERIGPDCMINKFGVNIIIDGKTNHDVDKSTSYSKKIGRLLSVNADKDNHRVPLVIFQSIMEPKIFGPALKEFEISIGLTQNLENEFGCMVNTVMNPWQASGEFVWRVGEIYREACLLAHGWETDQPAKHMFVCGDLLQNQEDEWFMFAYMVGQFGRKTEQYECVTKLGLANQSDAITIQNYQKNHGLFASNKENAVLYQLLLDAAGDKGAEFEFTARDDSTGVLFTAFLKVLDTPRVKHFETQEDPDLKYPDHYQYFMYGQGGKTYLSHMITKKPDFQQVVEVESSEMSGNKDDWLLWYGFPVTFTGLAVSSDTKANPFTRSDRTYHIMFAGEKNRKREMDIVLKDNTGWFENYVLNR
ncbi:uncharacterized protein LOC114533638 [Dendronephthya gigantea]|uniref:uncharacterized protein LOC114533638 n=1 Tax=Dendronephthya gigantea TaxID=151771 RepID=UPI0010692AC7|nr:uncharacterized protein LOC114533638 [Dendronephthya gigantea]